MKKTIVLVFAFLVCAVCIACVDNTAPQHFDITYVALNGGTIVGEKYQSVEKGNDTATVTASPNDDYVFSHWSDGETQPSRQEKNVQNNITLTAVFSKAEDGIKLSISYKAGDGGYISKAYQEQSEHIKQAIPYGQNADKIIALPYDDYDFVKWSDGLASPERTDKNITCEFTVTAVFAKIVKPLHIKATYKAGEGGYIDNKKEKVQDIIYGEDAQTVAATPDLGYAFVKWSDGEESPERTDENITYEFTVTAIFRFVFEGGDGTQSSPYLIKDYSQLAFMTSFANYKDLHFRLVCDIDMTGTNHVPFFDFRNTAFQSSFDGDNHTIKSMTVDTHHQFPSLFGFVGTYGSVKNLNMTDATIKMPNYASSSSNPLCVGAVAGVSLGILENINVSGEITAEKLDYSGIVVGGVVGQANAKMENCHAEMTITLNKAAGSTISAGGLAGFISDDIAMCSSKGTITIDFTADKNYRTVGGLVGLYLESSGTEQFKITDCFSETQISCNANAMCGGLIADIDSKAEVIITNCYAEADITCVGYAGGLISEIDADNFLIEDCYTAVNIIAGNRPTPTGYSGSWAGGFAYEITSNSGMINNCYAVGYVEGSYVGGFITSIPSNLRKDNYITISNCYADVDTKGSDASGFVLRGMSVNFYRCYSTGRTEGRWYAAGFMEDLAASHPSYQAPRGRVEECFSTGDVVSEENAYGFMGYADYCDVVNCYSTSDIYITNTNPNQYVYAIGFIGILYGVKIENCYYSGKINGIDTGNNSNRIYGFTERVWPNAESEIINCYWVKYSDGLAKEAMMDNNGNYEIYEYENVNELYNLADALNAEQEQPVWVDVPNSPPQLKFTFDEN